MNNQHPYRTFFFIIGTLLLAAPSFAQNDSSRKFIPVDSMMKQATPLRDSAKVKAVVKVHDPKKAARRSAILPGWGQIYNKKYWKLPLVYGALAIPGTIFAYNLKNYRELRFAYKAKYAAIPRSDAQGNPILPDSTGYRKIKPHLLPLDINALRSYRDEFRRNIDYSVLAIILVWGLNVVDATVDAHLKSFDISPDLSFKIKLGPSQMAGTNGLSLILALK